LVGLPGNRWGGGNPANVRGWRAAIRPATPERSMGPLDAVIAETP